MMVFCDELTLAIKTKKNMVFFSGIPKLKVENGY